MPGKTRSQGFWAIRSFPVMGVTQMGVFFYRFSISILFFQRYKCNYIYFTFNNNDVNIILFYIIQVVDLCWIRAGYFFTVLIGHVVETSFSELIFYLYNILFKKFKKKTKNRT